MTEASHPTSAEKRSAEEIAATARVRRRYAAERRFKAFGVGALVLTTLFLVALLTNIVIKAVPAFFAHSADLAVNVDASVVSPDGKRDAAALATADYGKLVREALAKAVPGVEGRSARKALSGLISSGAADELRARVISDPSIIGTTVTLPTLLSDDADLYFKSTIGDARVEAGRGALTLSGTSGDVEVTSADGAFKGVADAARAAGIAADAATGELALPTSLPSAIVETGGGAVKIESVKADGTAAKGQVLIAPQTADAKAWTLKTLTTPQARRGMSDAEMTYLEHLRSAGVIERNFNWRFFTSGDSREPELAGIRGALVGSALTLLVTLALCLPVGVLGAIYLEEFAPKNRLTDLVEVNINNLAAVPSIVFGLLGLAVFLNFFNLPRSAPVVGGLVLALLVLPTIIIAARAAIRAVPPSIREGAIGLGASKQQAVFHHVLPLAMPGIMTGTIIGMAHALGETAPLLMIGMVAFIVDVPSSLTQAATVLPVQIFLWSDLPEAAFQQRTAAAIVVLLAFLFAMNGAAIWLRSKFERRW